jgi:regulator of protease activity HflC (stomatin/prohibitin superfamily)
METPLIVGLAIAAWIILLGMGIHRIDEGFVGIYYRGGELLDYITEPGYHTQIPFITTHEQVQTTIQTDKVENIPCGTSGGVMIVFGKIEVVNRLKKELTLETIRNYTQNYDKTWIYNKIHHEINQFCSLHTLQQVYIDEFDTLDEALMEALQKDCNKWAPGIEIIAIRVTKPRIPASLNENYENIEREKASLLIATERAKVTTQEYNQKRNQETILANSDYEVAKIDMEKMLKEKVSQYEMSRLSNSIYLEKEKSIADSEFYKSQKELETEKMRLSPEYLKLLEIESLKDVPKKYFVESLEEIHNSMENLIASKPH